ncbi:MAG: hypothetical protein ACTHMJ_19850 [Thermomicrobiales bacterium]
MEYYEPRVEITHLDGCAPQQAHGTIDGLPFYLRVRHGRWWLAIAAGPHGNPLDEFSVEAGRPGGWLFHGPILDGSRDAGMLREEDVRVLLRAAAYFYATASLIASV